MTTAAQSPAPKDLLPPAADWRDIVARIGDLPPMPHVAARAIALVEKPETTASELSELLSSDTALAARVLKIANSAMFSRQRKITTLSQAVMTIGFKALKGIIIAAALRQMNKSFSPFEKMVWENSMCTAMAATRIAKKLRRPYVDEIFLLGLLHTLGQVVLLSSKETAAQYRDVIALIEAEHIDFAAAENRVYSFAHPLLGALVAKKWNFSAETCQTILHYKNVISGDSIDGDVETKAAIVQLADAISHRAGIGSPPGYPDQLAEALAVAKALGFPPSDCEAAITALTEESRAQFEAERHIYE